MWRLSTPCLISPYKTNTAPSGCVSSPFVIIVTDVSSHFDPATPTQTRSLLQPLAEKHDLRCSGLKGRNVQKAVFPVGEMRTAIKSRRMQRDRTSGLWFSSKSLNE